MELLFSASVEERDEECGEHRVIFRCGHQLDRFGIGINQEACFKTCNLTFGCT